MSDKLFLNCHWSERIATPAVFDKDYHELYMTKVHDQIFGHKTTSAYGSGFLG